MVVASLLLYLLVLSKKQFELFFLHLLSVVLGSEAAIPVVVYIAPAAILSVVIVAFCVTTLLVL